MLKQCIRFITVVTSIIKESFTFSNEKGRVRILLFNKRIFSYNKENKLYTRIFCKNRNTNLNKNNMTIKTVEEKKFLFVVESLELNGGMQKRLFQYATYLRKSGIEPYFLCQYNDYPPIIDNFVLFRLCFNDLDFYKNLLLLIKNKKFDIVEFQFGRIDYFEKINIIELKKFCRVGITLHNFIKLPLKQVSYANYILTSFDTNLEFIPNKVTIQNSIWNFKNQKNAIIISRLSSEKLSTIESFIDFCIKKEIAIHIAGPLKSRESFKIREYINKKYRDINIVFLGNIDTISFLKNHSDEYLFVGGVGQVILEAISLGFPAFVCSHFGADYSSFVNEENFELLQKNNFVLNLLAGKITISHKLPDMNYTRVQDNMLDSISFDKIFDFYKEKIIPK